jgi:hypothetical protein
MDYWLVDYYARSMNYWPACGLLGMKRGPLACGLLGMKRGLLACGQLSMKRGLLACALCGMKRDFWPVDYWA